MNKQMIAGACLVAIFVGSPVYAQQNQAQQGLIIESETHSIFKGLFLNVWEKLRTVNPTQKQSAKADLVYAAGIRGAESTDTLLKPYWKDDLARDESFQAELSSFSMAQLKMDKGDLKNAVKDFEAFIHLYRNSSLRPNALFARSISLAGMGKKEQSRAGMQLFIDENPNHPLIADAKQILGELSG